MGIFIIKCMQTSTHVHTVHVRVQKQPSVRKHSETTRVSAEHYQWRRKTDTITYWTSLVCMYVCVRMHVCVNIEYSCAFLYVCFCVYILHEQFCVLFFYVYFCTFFCCILLCMCVLMHLCVRVSMCVSPFTILLWSSCTLWLKSIYCVFTDMS